MINYFEGSVAVDGQPLEQKFGRFPELKSGSELRTDQGRAEILLTPGVFLRVDQNSSIRMVSNRLADARVEFIGGSAALEAANASPLTLVYRDYQVQFPKAGHFRINSAPAELRVEDGEAVVSLHSKSVTVAANQLLPFDQTMAARSIDKDVNDALDRWSQNRSASIASDNASATASDNMTADLNNPTATPYDFGTATPYTYGSSGLDYPMYSSFGYGPSYWGYSSPFYMYPGVMFPRLYMPPLYRGYTGIAPLRPSSLTRTTGRMPISTWSAPSRIGTSMPHPVTSAPRVAAPHVGHR
ncbi:MAG TPA: hypothetical protein VKU01_30695 [Bryobacteraceae bacterium]|nr:hypothetical protein [Bryobacteraceae bacterium]